MLAALAGWQFDYWGRLTGFDTPAEYVAALEHWSVGEDIPAVLVALDGSELLGSVNLRRSEIESRPALTVAGTALLRAPDVCQPEVEGRIELQLHVAEVGRHDDRPFAGSARSVQVACFSKGLGQVGGGPAQSVPVAEDVSIGLGVVEDLGHPLGGGGGEPVRQGGLELGDAPRDCLVRRMDAY